MFCLFDSYVTCDFTEFFEDFRFAFGFGYVAHKESQVGYANVYFQMPSAFHFHIIQLYVATQLPLIISTSVSTALLISHWSTSLEQPKHPFKHFKNLQLYLTTSQKIICFDINQMKWGKVYLSNSFESCIRCCEGDKSITSVEISQRIHHQSQVPDGSTLLK